MNRILVMVALFGCYVFGSAHAASLPAGFGETRLASGLDPTHLAIAPDGRIFVTEKPGRVRIIQNDALIATPFLDIVSQVDNYNERGTFDLVFDPNFASNRYLYLFYTAKNPATHNRISRFRADAANPNVVEAGSETILLEIDNSQGSIHNGGAMVFGTDGKLYATSGESGNGNNAQDTTDVLGKVLRLNSDGTIPTDNPFYNNPSYTGKQKAIFCHGVRNPFSMAIQPGTGKIFLGDVGGGSWEEINEVASGRNFGWPNTEGDFTQSSFPTYTRPIYAYNHGVGVAITGGTFYNPTTANFPSAYVGKYFFCDYGSVGNSWIKVLDFTATPVTVTSFATSVSRPLSVVAAPNGYLYYIARGGQGGGSEGDNTTTANGEVYKVFYTGSGAPTISVNPSDVSVLVGQTAGFSVIANGTNLNYQWQKNQVNIGGATAATYTTPATVAGDNGSKFRCIVSNTSGSATTTEATLTVINQVIAPVITPASGLYYTQVSVSMSTGTTGASIRYTTDGSTPSSTVGTLYSGPFALTNSAPVKAIAYKAGSTDSTVSSATYTVNPLLDAENPSPVLSGVNYSYYEGNWDLIPDFNALTPVRTGTVANFDISQRNVNDYFGHRFTGFINVPTDGTYTFYTTSDDGSTLYIGNTLVVNNDGLHGEQEASGVIGLKAGKHAIRVEFFEKGGGEVLTVSYDGPGIAKQLIPNNALFRSNPYGIDVRGSVQPFLNMPGTETGAIPSLLSQTGAFSNVSALTPSSGIVPYDVNTPLWSDGALKRRWISVPSGSKMTFAPTGEWLFPAGTVLIKHFEFDLDEGAGTNIKRLETRVLVIKSGGGVYGVTYRWRADNTDADLLPGSATDPLTITQAGGGTRSQTWTYPSRTDCMTCHTQAAGFVLGVKTRQLNGDFTYPSTGRTDNQLRTLNNLGLFTTPLTESLIPGYDKLVKVLDSTASLELRSRSYIDANCSQCHRPGGVAFPMDMRFDTPLANQNLINQTVSNTLGIDGAKVIVPADTTRSIMHIRINTVDGNRMPPIGRSVIDQDAQTTIAAWINSMTGTPTLAAPTISPNGGIFNGSISVTLSHVDSGATIRYTLDNSDPTATSTIYSAPFTLTSNTTVRARAFKTGFNMSTAAVASFTIGPVITVSTSSLALGSTTAGTASGAQSYTVSGSGLTANISITAPSGVEVRNAAGGTFGGSVSLVPSGGVVANTTIEARIAASAPAGSISGNIANASSGATTQNVAVTGTVNTVTVGNGTGLKGDYFNNRNLTNPVTYTRTDATVNFDWGGGSPDASIPADNFSARWTGQVQAQFSETYTFYTNSDDGIRLYINNVAVIDNFTDHPPTENSGTIALTAGTKYDVRLEFYENGGGAVAMLSWSSASTPKAIIPQTQLYPAAGTLTPTITASKTTLALGTTTTGTAGAAQNYTVSGANLTANLVVTAPANVEVRNATGGTFGSSVTLVSAGGTVATTTIEARLAASAPVGSINGTITNASTGATTQTLSVSGTVNPVTTGTGTGLKGEYFANMTLGGAASLTRTDATVNFDWGNGTPGAPIPADLFSVRWSGQVQAQFSETYTFYTNSDDGIRLWVNGVQVINNWNDHGPTEDSGTISLAAGQKYSILLEFYENGGGAVAQLRWSSASTAKTVIPQTQLYPATSGGAQPGNGTGLQGDYFANMTLGGAPFTRIDPTVDFGWGTASPAAGIPVDQFSVRWTGQVFAQYNETYTFYTQSDDGIRLWVNGVQVINNWTDHSSFEDSGTITLTAGIKYDVVLEFYENGVDAEARLKWSSLSTPKAVIPQSQLFPPAAQAQAKLAAPAASLPSPWISADIGTVGQAGSGSATNNVFTVKGSGLDIGSTSDQFQFVYRTLTGNGQITARVASFDGVNVDSKVGVMMRASTTANSAFVYACATPGGTTSIRRSSTGGTANVLSKSTATKVPCWVRVVRASNTFTTYRSLDGVTWTRMEQVNITMGSSILIGLAVTSKDNTTRATATFDSVSAP